MPGCGGCSVPVEHGSITSHCWCLEEPIPRDMGHGHRLLPPGRVTGTSLERVTEERFSQIHLCQAREEQAGQGVMTSLRIQRSPGTELSWGGRGQD